jgi:hypothetical protein
MDDQNQYSNNSIREDVKKRALEALLPLVDDLNEPPERKFDIIMIAVRSSEEENLLSKALDVALKIVEPSTKADALLDVINEASFQRQQEAK